jgi:hypothetical protein
MDRFERQPLDEPIRSDLHWPGPLSMQPTALGQRHFALRLAASQAESAAIWPQLPPLDGANKFRELAPVAIVLAEAGPKTPLLVVHQYGDGRVMAFAGDSTWRWPLHGFEAAHKRFWRQIVLWLAKKDQAVEGSVWVKLDKRRFMPNERVEFTVGARDASGEPITDAEFTVKIVLPNGTSRPVSLVEQDRQMSGSFPEKQAAGNETQAAGDYVIEVQATQKNAELGSTQARFLVFQQDLELDNASADGDTMKSLAAMTGGESLAPEDLGNEIKRFAEQTAGLEIRQETKKTFWDTWIFFLTLVSLLSLEWYLRKSWGLV